MFKLNSITKIMLATQVLFGTVSVHAVGFEEGNLGEIVGPLTAINENWRQLPAPSQTTDQLLTVPIMGITSRGNKSASMDEFGSFDDTYTNMCTGTLIGDRYVITSSWCVGVLLEGEVGSIRSLNLMQNYGGEVPIQVQFYTNHPDLLPSYCPIFKFYLNNIFCNWVSGYSFPELDRIGIYYPTYAPDEELYERIKVKRLHGISEGVGNHLVLLELSRVPKIVTNQVVDPKHQIQLGNYKKVMADEAARSEAYQCTSASGEIMGFGKLFLHGDMPARVIKYLPSQQAEKLGFNLRSSAQGIPFPRTLVKAGNRGNRFNYVFYGQSSDPGDRGGPFYWYATLNQPGRPVCGGLRNAPSRSVNKVLLGVIMNEVRYGDLVTGVWGSKVVNTVEIQGFSDKDIAEIEEIIN